MLSYLLAQPVNGWLAVSLYWSPLLLCIVGYTMRTVRNYRLDLSDRESDKFYTPRDRVGTLIGRAFVSLMPIANLWAAAFDLAPKLFSGFFSFLGRVFDQPLVPKLDKQNPKAGS